MRPISAVSEVPARPGKQQACDHRPQFAHQRQVDDQAQAFGRAIGHQRVVHLQRQHKAHRQARGHDDDQRAVADGMHLRHDQAEAPQRCRHCHQQIQEEERRMAPAAELFQRDGAQFGDEVHGARRPKSVAISGAG
jgi:hypothetical protein